MQAGQRRIALGHDRDAFEHELLTGDNARPVAPADRALKAILDDVEVTPARVASRFERNPFNSDHGPLGEGPTGLAVENGE